MGIKQKSMKVLEKLYNTLINSDASSLAITINTKQFAESINMTDKEVCQCICYLKSAGYVEPMTKPQVIDETQSTALTAMTIDFLEQSN